MSTLVELEPNAAHVSQLSANVKRAMNLSHPYARAQAGLGAPPKPTDVIEMVHSDEDEVYPREQDGGEPHPWTTKKRAREKDATLERVQNLLSYTKDVVDHSVTADTLLYNSEVARTLHDSLMGLVVETDVAARSFSREPADTALRKAIIKLRMQLARFFSVIGAGHYFLATDRFTVHEGGPVRRKSKVKKQLPNVIKARDLYIDIRDHVVSMTEMPPSGPELYDALVRSKMHLQRVITSFWAEFYDDQDASADDLARKERVFGDFPAEGDKEWFEAWKADRIFRLQGFLFKEVNQGVAIAAIDAALGSLPAQDGAGAAAAAGGNFSGMSDGDVTEGEEEQLPHS